MRALVIVSLLVASLAWGSTFGATPTFTPSGVTCNSTTKGLQTMDGDGGIGYWCDGTTWQPSKTVPTPQFCINGEVVYGLNLDGTVACSQGGVDAGTYNAPPQWGTTTALCNFSTQTAQTYGGADGGTMTICSTAWQVINPKATPIAINADAGGLSIFPAAGDLWKSQTGTRTATYLMTSVCNLGVTSWGQAFRFKVWLHDETTPINFDGWFAAVWAPAVSGTTTLAAQGTVFWNGGTSSDFEWSSATTSGSTNISVLYDGGLNINTVDLQVPSGSPMYVRMQHAVTSKGGTPSTDDTTYIPVFEAASLDFSSNQSLVQNSQTFGFGATGFGAPGNGIAPNICFIYVALGCSTNTGGDTTFNCNLGGYQMQVR